MMEFPGLTCGPGPAKQPRGAARRRSAADGVVSKVVSFGPCRRIDCSALEKRP
jgi:hypothetical protein